MNQGALNQGAMNQGAMNQDALNQGALNQGALNQGALFTHHADIVGVDQTEQHVPTPPKQPGAATESQQQARAPRLIPARLSRLPKKKLTPAQVQRESRVQAQYKQMLASLLKRGYKPDPARKAAAMAASSGKRDVAIERAATPPPRGPAPIPADVKCKYVKFPTGERKLRATAAAARSSASKSPDNKKLKPNSYDGAELTSSDTDSAASGGAQETGEYEKKMEEEEVVDEETRDARARAIRDAQLAENRHVKFHDRQHVVEMLVVWGGGGGVTFVRSV